MRTYARSLKRWGWVLALAVPFAACDQGPSPEVQAQIEELEATRDSLSRQLAQRTEAMERLSSTIEEVSQEIGGTAVTSPEQLQDRIIGMADELENTREQLAEAQRRIRAMSNRSSRLRDSLDTVTARQDEALAMQRDSIAGLMASIDSLASRAEELSTAQAELNETLESIEDRYFTAYVTVGTEDELLEQGIVEEKGGARILLLLWKAGETLVPARDLTPGQFRAIDFRETATIELPGPGTYRLISRQNTGYLEPRPDEEGRFTGDSLRVTQPEQFWHSSPYLILLREE